MITAVQQVNQPVAILLFVALPVLVIAGMTWIYLGIKNRRP